VTLEKYFHVSAAHASYIICFTTLTLGFGNLLWVPLTRVIGKRPLFLISPLLLVAFNVWSYKTTSFGSLVAARICSGFAAAAGDAPVPSLVADLFPVTERGFAMMFFQLSLSCGFFVGPVINAYIVQNTGGWQWCCGWIAIAAAFNWVLVVFFVWETNVPRAQREKIQPRHSWLSRMSVTKGYDKDSSFWRALKDIVILAMYPPITWAGILTGALVGW
jgi:MFS family permease